MPLFAEPNPNALKHLIGPNLLKQLASKIGAVDSSFDQKRFHSIERELLTLELKPRVRLVRESLRSELPSDFSHALKILLASVTDGTVTGFGLWPVSDFIQTYGLNHAQLSLDALKQLTPLFSSEFAIRPFLRLFPEKTLQFLKQCALSPNVDLRRWASEGTRPRLPWGERLQAFIQDPAPTLAILELLKFDPELYVRKSVANHLNDIAKDHPKRVIEVLMRWRREAGSEHAEKIDWITHRALRTLIKNGDEHALQSIGVEQDVAVHVSKIKLNQSRFRMNERIEFEFSVQSAESKPQRLVIDYIVHFVRANSKTSPKVFKLKTLTIPPRGTITISKHHTLRPVTTREHYPGEHRIEIQVNGRVLSMVNWLLAFE